jgi:hypothetical protein
LLQPHHDLSNELLLQAWMKPLSLQQKMCVLGSLQWCEVLELPSWLPLQLLHDEACPLRQHDELFQARLYAFVKSLLSFLSRDQARLD